MIPIRPSLRDYTATKGVEAYVQTLMVHCNDNPDDIDAQIDLMSINAKLGRVDEYKRISRNILKLNPDNFYANRLRGRYSLCIERDIEQARHYFQCAVDQNPSEPAWSRHFAGMRLNYYERVANGVLYTPIGKNGSSTIKSIYAKRMGLESATSDPHMVFSNPYFQFNFFKDSELKSSVKIVITRDPISRFMSYCQANINAESSLSFEVNADNLKHIYGLQLNPSPDILAAKLWQYLFCFDDVMAHLLPQRILMPEPSQYDIIGDIAALDKVIFQTNKRVNFKDENKHPKLMKSFGTKTTLNKSSNAILREFYAEDYEMLLELVKNCDHYIKD